MLFRKPVNVTPHQQQQQQQQQSQPTYPTMKTPPSSMNHLGTPSNDDAHSPSPKRVTIVEGVSTPSRLAGGGGGGGVSEGRGTRGGSATPRTTVATSSPPPTPPNYNNRYGQPPNVPPSCLKDSTSSSALKNTSPHNVEIARNPISNMSNSPITNVNNPISSIAAPTQLAGGRNATFAGSYEDDDQYLSGSTSGGLSANPITASIRRPSAPRGSSIESSGSGSAGGGPSRQNSRPESGPGGVGGGLAGNGAFAADPAVVPGFGSPGSVPGGAGPGFGGPGGGGGGAPGFGVTFAPSTKSDNVIPAPRSRSVERDLDDFVRENRNARAKSIATTRTAEGEEVLSRLDALINDVVNSSSTTQSTTSRGRSRGRSPGGAGGGGGGGAAGRSSSLMARSAYEPKNYDLEKNVSPEPNQTLQKQQRGRSLLRDTELDRLARDVTSMTRSTMGTRGFSMTRDFSGAREFSVARELSMGRDFAAPVESTVSKVYVSSLEPSDKICMKVRAAIQREVTMTNKKVDLVWNKIQTLKETNDIMEEIICQTEDELCYCEELTDAVGLDLTDILTDAEDREQLLNYELQLLQEMRRVEEEGSEDGDVDGTLGEGEGEGGDGVDGDPLQKRSSINAMKKKAQKKFTRLKRRESEDIMNSTKCKIS